MAFIEPIHRNKPNITYLYLLQGISLLCDEISCYLYEFLDQ